MAEKRQPGYKVSLIAARSKLHLLAGFLLAFLQLLWAPGPLAQTCSRGILDLSKLGEEMYRANSPDAVYRSAAIATDALVPILLGLSKPDMAADSIPGAAQVSLARLGREAELAQLEKELSDPTVSSNAIKKLVRVGTDKAISVLMTYLRVHLSDTSLHHDFGDSGLDIRSDIIELLSTQLQIGPAEANGTFSVYPKEWVTWWSQHSEVPVALSISREFEDPFLRCLARKVEWGFPDAVFDMARTQDPHVIPVLKHLASFGNPKRRPFNLTTFHGRAQLALARLGDPDELEEVKRELDLPGFGSAIGELQQAGGPIAVAALINALDSPSFLAQYRGSPGYQREVLKRNQDITNALATMILAPPAPKVTSKYKETWQEWWSKNKDTVVFVSPPVKSYE